MTLNGRIEVARQGFAKALDGTTNLRILSLGYALFQRIGELNEAERLLRRRLAVSGRDQPAAETAAALGNLGLIAQTRANLDEAEKLLRESLEINRNLGRLDGQAIQLGNLGSIAKQRGNSAEARRLWTESRDLYAGIGMPCWVKKLQGWLGGLPPEQPDAGESDSRPSGSI